MRGRAKSVALAALVAILAVPVAGTLPAAGGDGTVLTYSVREARAYAYRVALRREVIEAARNADPCDPAEDAYECDTTRYNREPNCTSGVEIGRAGKAPKPATPPGAEAASGGAGDATGAAARPPLSSPITVNELLTLASLGNVRGVAEAYGLASDSYIDLSGRQDPELHTESDAFTPNQRQYEERCLQEEGSEDSYRHLLSRSSAGPETYHLAECAGDQCTFDQLFFSADTVRGRTVVYLVEEDGKVKGRLEATFQNTSWGDGAFAVDLLETYVSFESDGTPGGLEWSVGTITAGAELQGSPVTLAPGEVIGNEDFQVGIAAPFVEASNDGRKLEIVAPGLYLATGEQSAFFGGAEVNAVFGRANVALFEPEGPGEVEPPPPVSPAVDTSGGTGVAPPPSAPPEPPAEEPEEPSTGGGLAGPEPVVSIEPITTGTWPIVVIAGLALLGLVLILGRWVGRFPWGRSLYRTPAVRAIDWMYRAFVKS